MSLKTKIDYFGLSADGIEPESTSQNLGIGYYAEAQDSYGFVCATSSGGTQGSPQVNYIVTKDANLSGVVLGSVKSVSDNGLCGRVALGGVTITTAAGSAPTIQATGQLIESGSTDMCKCTLNMISVDHLYHAQDFGLITVSGGQLTNSTLQATGNIATAVIDGEIKSSDLVGGSLVMNVEIVGVDNGAISQPTVTMITAVLDGGTWTTPLSESNPNGQFPTYSGTITWPLKRDAE